MRQIHALLLSAAGLTLTSAAHAAVLVDYNGNASNGVFTASAPGSLVAATNLTPGTSWGSFGGNSGGVGYGQSNFTGTPIAGGNPIPGMFIRSGGLPSDLQTAESSSFWEFTVTPNAGQMLNLTSFTFDWTLQIANNEGTTETTVLGSNANADAASFSDIANSTNSLTLATTGATGWSNASIDLSGPAFQHLTQPTTFRLYVYDSPHQTDNLPRFDNIIVNGASVAVPEPASASLLIVAGGLLAARRRVGRR